MEQTSTRGGPPGGHNPPGRARRPRRALVGAALLGPPLLPIFWYISHFDLEKIRRGHSDEVPPPRGRTWAGALLPSGGAILPEELPSRRGKSSSSSSPHLGEGNLHQQHLLSNHNSSLVFNLCTGTLDWYLWVTSSVDYIL